MTEKDLVFSPSSSKSGGSNGIFPSRFFSILLCLLLPFLLLHSAAASSIVIAAQKEEDDLFFSDSPATIEYSSTTATKNFIDAEWEEENRKMDDGGEKQKEEVEKWGDVTFDFVPSYVDEEQDEGFGSDEEEADDGGGWDGGWKEEKEENWPGEGAATLFSPPPNGRCSIERVDGAGLGQQQFLTSFAFSKPVIIENVGANARNAIFKKSRMLREWGNAPVVLASANTYSYTKLDSTFGAYVQQHLTPQNGSVPANGERTTNGGGGGKKTFYLFGDIDREIWKRLLDEYRLPEWELPEHEPALSFGVAALGTGVPFHFHGPGFAEVIFGAKRWFLYPFEKRPEWDPDKSTLHWARETLPKLSAGERPLECVLTPGELIYFPDKWWHATLNVKTSVFFSTFLSPVNRGNISALRGRGGGGEKFDDQEAVVGGEREEEEESSTKTEL